MADMYDPLGVGARQRAADYHRQWEEDQREQARQQGQYVSFGQLGPLRDPSWDAYFQVLQEKGVDRLAGGSLPQWQPPRSTAGAGQTPLPAYQGLMAAGPRRLTDQPTQRLTDRPTQPKTDRPDQSQTAIETLLRLFQGQYGAQQERKRLRPPTQVMGPRG